MPAIETTPTSKRVQRFDVGRFDKFEQIPGGGLRIPAALTRVGVFTYKLDGGGVLRELRPAEEVLAASSVASLDGAPVTDLHPDEQKYPDGLVTATNWKALSVGDVRSPRADGAEILAEVILRDSSEIRLVESGDRGEISCGYECDHDPKPGVFDGEAYDVVQRNIRYNHVALGPRGWGRAGPATALRLDSNSRQVRDAEETRMRKVKVDGIEYDAGSDSHIQASERLIERLVGDVAATKKEADTQRGRADGLETRVTEITGQLTEAKTKLDKAMSPAELDARVAQRVSLIDRSRRVMGADYVGEGKTDRQVMDDVLGKANVKLAEGSSDDYARGRFEQATEVASDAEGAGASGGGATTDSKDKPRKDGVVVTTTDPPKTGLEKVRHDNRKFHDEAPARFAMKKD